MGVRSPGTESTTRLFAPVPVSASPGAQERRTPPAVLWTGVGAVIFAFEMYVLVRWLVGPGFRAVPSGPSVPPPWMKAALIALQVLMPAATIGCAYRFVARPWIRDKRLSTDGVFVIAFFTMTFQDALSNYFGTWITYNSWMLNMGSWFNSIPGWLSYGQAGRMVPEPLLFTPMAYIPSFVVPMLLGPRLMRMAKVRWPRASKLELVAICFVAMMVFDFVEETLFMFLGAYTNVGALGPAVFPGTYHKFAIVEAIAVGALCAVVASLRYFVDGRGQTVVERGLDRLNRGPRTKGVMRVVALVGALQVGMLVCYSIPMSLVGAHSATWPADVQKRSYLTDYVCGATTDRACPGPAVPILRNDNSAHGGGSTWVSPDGNVVWPSRTERPKS